MKQLLIILFAICFTPTLQFGQQAGTIISKYKEVESLNYISLSSSSVQKKFQKNDNWDELAKKIKKMKLIMSDNRNTDVTQSIQQELASLSKKQGYMPLIQVKSDGSSIIFKLKPGRNDGELVGMIASEETLIVMALEGDFQKQDGHKLMDRLSELDLAF